MKKRSKQVIALANKYGSEENYRQHMREIRKLVKKHPGGSFKNNSALAKKMSKKALVARWGTGPRRKNGTTNN